MKIKFSHIKDVAIRKRVESAVRVFLESGKDSETQARRLFSKKGPCTIYDLAKGLDWSEGKAQGAIKRLEKAKIIKQLPQTEENGRIKKFYGLRSLAELSSD